ncbi:MAG: hypothetical protein Q9168_008411, partial [Polycauliona sp. 1 TL-2023]
MGLTFGSLSLNEPNNTNNSPDPNLCTQESCPLNGSLHNKGLYLYSDPPAHSIQFHADFGYSNPPPYIWAAYKRYQLYKEAEKDELSKEIFGSELDPCDELRSNDVDIVMGFLRFHAITLAEK